MSRDEVCKAQARVRLAGGERGRMIKNVSTDLFSSRNGNDLHAFEPMKSGCSRMPRGKMVGVKTFNIGDTAYIVRHCPFQPTGEDNGPRQWVDMAYDLEEDEVFTSLVKAIAFARKACQKSFWGLAEVFEARLVNPYSDDIPDRLIKRSALKWEPVEGGYECEVER